MGDKRYLIYIYERICHPSHHIYYSKVADSSATFCYDCRMKRLRIHRLAWLLAWIAVNMLFFGLISPLERSSILLFAGFGLLAVDIYLLLTGLIQVAASRIRGKKWRHPRRFAVVWTFVCVALLSLQSIGQLSARDGIAAVIIAAIFLAYSTYYRFKR
jgi:hypothetical protein